MKSYLVKTPKFVQWIFSERIWTFPNNNNFIYLTFDDGPIPEVTPWALEILKKHQAKATFFCIGDNIKKHPEVLKQIIYEGHTVGNHSFNHLNGWNTNTNEYIDNCGAFHKILRYTLNDNSKISNLFRPPFGKTTSKQSKILQKKGYKIIMWDVLSADFDATISKKKCLKNVLTNLEPGSIVVFHDSLKAEEKLRYVLPKVLEYIKEKGFICKAISV